VPLSYQWRKNTVNISGARANSYVIASASAADIGSYDCVVTNSACGSTSSDMVTLTVCVADFDDGSGTGTCDAGVTLDDLLYYLNLYGAGDIHADVDDGTATGTRDNGVTLDDLLYFLSHFESGC
jgi:hypothetical protein